MATRRKLQFCKPPSDDEKFAQTGRRELHRAWHPAPISCFNPAVGRPFPIRHAAPKPQGAELYPALRSAVAAGGSPATLTPSHSDPQAPHPTPPVGGGAPGVARLHDVLPLRRLAKMYELILEKYRGHPSYTYSRGLRVSVWLPLASRGPSQLYSDSLFLYNIRTERR